MPKPTSSTSRIAGVLLVLVSAAVITVTLAMSPAFINSYTVPKAVALLTAAGLMTSLLVVALPDALSSLSSVRLLLMTLTGQFLVLITTTAFSTSRTVSFWGGDWRRMGMLTFFSMMVIALAIPVAIHGNQARWIGLLRVITAAGCVAALYGIVQWLGFDPFMSPGARNRVIESFGGVYRISGTIGQPTYYVTCLMYPLFSAVSLVRLESGRSWRRLALLTIFTSTISLVLTFTRSGLAGLAAALCLWLVLSGRASFVRNSAIVFVAGLTALGVPAVLLMRAGANLGGRFTLWSDILHGMNLRVWLIGTGSGMFQPWFAGVRSDRYAAFNPDTHWESAHNLFLDRLSEHGMLGLLASLVVIGAFLVNMRTAYRSASRDDSRSAIIALLCAFFGAIVSSLTAGEVIPTTFYLYLWVGLSAGTLDCFVPLKVRSNAPSWPLLNWRWQAALGCSVFASMVLLWHADRNWRADTSLFRAERSLHEGNLSRFLGSSAAAVASFPVESTYNLEVASTILSYIGGHGRALKDEDRARLAHIGVEYGKRAVADSDRPMLALYTISALGLAAGDDHVEDWVRALLAQDPHWYRAHLLYATLLLQQGEVEKARKHVVIAYKLAPYREEVKELQKQIQ